jgi:methylmalonyl-CoA/ethylmalonyl-CoA epimerase|tara:strand:- start:82 stop:492 length:411 start_codon:yes stop_codon:yes gene_type:complete
MKGIRLDHIGIAVNDLQQGAKFWELLGLIPSKDVEVNEEQGVNILFLSTSQGLAPNIELLEPTGENTPIGQFINKRGPGIQQLAFEVDDMLQMISHLESNGVDMIDKTPKIGAGGNKIAFVHPRSTGGVLVELVEK